MTTTLISASLLSRAPHARGREPIEIALVNNMSDAALQMTEQQFAGLLAAAGAEYNIRLRLFSFPELSRGQVGRAYVAQHYEPIEQLWSSELDGMIVTGAEPRTSALSEEVYWPSLTRLVNWATETSTPTIWSCLAAHAAVLQLDGIERTRLSEKTSGVFRCAKASDHPLVAGLPASWRIPHSRLNTLDVERLAAAGYEIVSLSDGAGADTFVLNRGATFVFFQGHPEYDASALFREYRRDVGRFLAGTMERYPEMPRGYFTDEMARAFTAFRALAHRVRSRELLDEFPGSDARTIPPHAWREVAVRLYSNWLASIVAPRQAESAGRARRPASASAT
ncbi:MAG TPA: homoserine O-succinyltransferase [Gemmatimonadaceae bacterium]|jgi:homoserine O-succinyltransferase